MWCFAGQEPLKRVQLFMYGKRLTSVVPEGNSPKKKTFFLTFSILILDISTTINSS